MKISAISDYQAFTGIKNKRNKINNKLLNDYNTRTPEDEKLYDDLERESVKMFSRLSPVIAAAMVAGAIGSGVIIYSNRPLSKQESNPIPEDIVDVQVEDIPSENHSYIIDVNNNFGVTNKTNPSDLIVPEELPDTDNYIYVEPATEAGKDEKNKGSVSVDIPKEGMNADEAQEDVEYIYESESPEDVEYIDEEYVPEEDFEVINENPVNYIPEQQLPPPFPPPYIWEPSIPEVSEPEETKLQFKNPLTGEIATEIRRDEVAGSVIFDDGSILVEESRNLYFTDGSFANFDKYFNDNEDMPPFAPPIYMPYPTDNFVFPDIKIDGETYYPIGMTEDGNVKFNDGSIIDVKTNIITRTNGSVYHFITGEMLTGPTNDSEIVVDNDKPRYPYPAFPPFNDPITGEPHKEVERTKTSIIYDDGSVMDIKTGKTTRPDGSVWGYGPVLLQVPEDPSGLAPYLDEDDNAHYAVKTDVDKNTATFDDESVFYVESGILCKADGSMWSWNGSTQSKPERLPDPVPAPDIPILDPAV